MSNRDDTPTSPAIIDVGRDQLDALARHPDDADLFSELHGRLRSAGHPALLAEICEHHAPHVQDDQAAAGLLREAGEARLHLGELERGEHDLARALQRDPGCEGAAARLGEHLMVAARWSEAADLFEAELVAIEQGAPADPAHAARRAARHRTLGQIWDRHLGRADRAVHHLLIAWQLEPEVTDALDAARAVLAQLGDEGRLAELYDLELARLGAERPDEPAPVRARRTRIDRAQGELAVRRGDHPAAAAAFERALARAQRSGDSEAIAALTDALARELARHPEAAAEGQTRAIELSLGLAGSRLAADDLDGAIACQRRALGLDPGHAIANDALAQTLERAGRLEELERALATRVAFAGEDQELVQRLLTRRATLLDGPLNRPGEATKLYVELAAREGQNGPTAQILRTRFAKGGDWTALAALLDAAAEAEQAPLEQRITDLLALAQLAREQLSDRGRAASALHRVLSLQPGHPEAMARYADHFREKRDWRGLVDLAGFAVEHARQTGAPADELARRLEELATVAEQRLGDVERALAAWRELGQLDPGHAKAKEALRRLEARTRMWESLVSALEKEAAAAPSPRERAEAMRRIAQVYRERQVDPRKAISLYEAAIAQSAPDLPTLKVLVDLYEREGDDAGASQSLRRVLELEAEKHGAQAQAAGGEGGVASWPAGARVERLAALRRLAVTYEQRLGDVEGVVWACTAILELLPGDRDTLSRLERTLELAGDHARLARTLEYHAAAAPGQADRGRALRRLAQLAQEAGEAEATVERWEAVVRAAPADGEALRALAELYERAGRDAELVAVLERLLTQEPPGTPGSAAAATRAAILERLARALDDRLEDAPRATRAWARLIEILPLHREGLSALARLYRQAGDWRELADVLGKLGAIDAEEDRAAAAEAILEQAALLEEKLGRPRDAIAVLEALVEKVDPRHAGALAALRRLHEQRGDVAQAVRAAERELLLVSDPLQRQVRLLEIGRLSRDRLTDAHRALHAYERALELFPDDVDVLREVASLNERVGRPRRQLAALARLIALAPGGEGRARLHLQAAEVEETALGDPRAAFVSARAAHADAASEASGATLRRLARAHAQWRELAEVLEEERVKARGLPARLAAHRELATVAEEQLHAPARALAVLTDALRVAPGDESFISWGERLVASHPTPELRQGLLTMYGIALGGRRGDVDAEVALHEKRARVLEETGDLSAAVGELLEAFAVAPDRETTRLAITRLATQHRRFAELFAVEAALVQRAPSDPARLIVLRRIARLAEEAVGDRARAFRAWLAAFVVAPQDGEVEQQLWRLAAAIGRYADGDRLAPPPDAPARVRESAEHVRRNRPTQQGRHTAPPPMPAGVTLDERPRLSPIKKASDATQELQLSDLLPLEGRLQTSQGKVRAESSIPLELDELAEVESSQKAARRDATIELATSDLIEALRPAAPPPPRPLPQRSVHLPGVHVPAGQVKPAPRKSYESPWEELATTIESQPAETLSRRLAHLYRAAEVWERGAGDLERAFQTLGRALGLEPGQAETRERLAQLAHTHKAETRLVRLYLDAAERANGPAASSGLLTLAAAMEERQGHPREAELLLRRVLGMRPEDDLARNALEALFERESRWVDLAALLEERTEVPVQERAVILRRLAVIYDERLLKPYEALSALERLQKLTHDAPDALEELARLYASVGRWAKAVDALTRLADHDSSARALAARRRIAEIYERELELPERAIDAYDALLSTWPEDAAALDAQIALLGALERGEALAEALRRRAALAETTPPERVQLLRQRARLELDLGQADHAVAALRHARGLAPEDGAIADEMAQALVAAGRQREAVTALEERLELLERQGSPAGETNACLLRLADLRAALGDTQGARRAVDEVLRRAPDHPSALAAAAKLASGDDPGTYAEARMREAAAAVDVGAKVQAYLEAGRTFRDRVGDLERAGAAFEQAHQLEPQSAEATWALAGLAAHGGHIDEAVRLLEDRLASATGPDAGEERARLCTELAALALRAGVPAVAEHRLADALVHQPAYVPAIVATADMLATQEAWSELEAFLRRELDARSASDPERSAVPGEVRADLSRRLALALERLGRDDEAYQLLLETDARHRGDLRVKLALGENRFRARRWREAALHLSSLAEHPQARSRAGEVAAGLFHAALAEIRSLRPERARPLYDAALALKPDHAPSLHAIAEQEIELGNVAVASDLLQRQAAATTDPGERLRLYETLGDLALRALDDLPRAASCYAAAVESAQPLESRHVPLLHKLLESQHRAGLHAQAGRSGELLASFAGDGATRASRLVEAADAYLQAGERERARAAAVAAAAANQFDEAAAQLASALLVEAGDLAEVASLLGRTLAALPAPTTDLAPRRAELWRRLGEARKARGDDRGATTAYERAVSLAADSDAAIASRRILAATSGMGKSDALAHLRAVATADAEPADVLALGRALAAETGAGPVDEDGGRGVLELAEALGATLADSDRAYLVAHPPRDQAADQPYAGSLDDADRALLIADPEDQPLYEVMGAVWEAAHALYPDPTRTLEQSGASRVPPTARGDAAGMYPLIARAMNAPATTLWATAAAGAPDIALACAIPPIVVLGHRVLPAPLEQGLPPLALRYILGRAVELARPERIAAVGVEAALFARLVAGLVRAYSPRRDFLCPGVSAEEAEAEAERLRKILTMRARLRIEPVLAGAPLHRLDPATYRAACERAADRAGLLVSGDVRTALKLAGGAARAPHLVRLALSEAYFAVRAKLGVGV
jgi:tetratricopeptide (TPR) repeat protein